jgi:NTP pyrophosphatase (non-canonical NTP hydrolase)
MSFKKEFNRVAKACYKISAEHGFHEGDENYLLSERNAQFAQRLMLTVSELSEALEALRHDDPPDSHIKKFRGTEAELADAVIRIMDISETYGLRLADAIIAKMSYNHKRPKMHGKKF